MATIRDVAQAAGVSIATVSRVFNDSPRVTDQTRVRVREAATRLDYWPHAGARSLTTSRAHALGVLLPDLYGGFFSEVIRGIDHGARDGGFQVLISSSHADADAVVMAARAMRGRIDGLVVMAPDLESMVVIEGIASRFPVVLMNPRLHIEGCSTVSIDSFRGAFDAVDHLVRLGHRNIGTVTGPPGNVDAEERTRGFRAALENAGLRAGFVIPGDFTEDSGYRAAGEILGLGSHPTAVFAANDNMAIGLLSALVRAGVEVPRELAVVGFDDVAMARYLSPPLTTVHVDAHDLGFRAVRMLLSLMGGDERLECRHDVVPAVLVVRQSCGSPGGGTGPRPRFRDDARREGVRDDNS